MSNIIDRNRQGEKIKVKKKKNPIKTYFKNVFFKLPSYD